jgi:lipid A 4'-phosphatase
MQVALRNNGLIIELTLMAALLLATFMAFAALPPVDLWISTLFYDADEGFWIAGRTLPEIVRRTIWMGSIIVVALSVVALTGKLVLRHDTFGVPGWIWGYVLALYIIVPGILVDGLLKRLWGRARPANIAYFGGEADFSLPHQITQNCLRNCSFVAGEVAGATVLSIALILILRHRHPRPSGYQGWVTVCLAFPLASALQRIAAGRHFASDVVFAMLLVGICGRLLWVLIKPAKHMF